jgi:hypothetical protein
VRRQPKDQPFALNLWFNACHAEDGDRRPGLHFASPQSADGMYDDIAMPPSRLNDPAIFESLPDCLQTSITRERFFWRWCLGQCLVSRTGNAKLYQGGQFVPPYQLGKRGERQKKARNESDKLPARLQKWTETRRPEATAIITRMRRPADTRLVAPSQSLDLQPLRHRAISLSISVFLRCQAS